MHRRTFVSVLCAASLCALSAAAKPKAAGRGLADKSAAEKPSAHETLIEVSVLHATREPRDDDPRIGNLPELREGPFAKYKGFQLLLKRELKLSRATKGQLELPNGHQLEARLADVLADGSSRLVASIHRPDAKDFLPLLEVKARPGQRFIVAGQSYKRGILVLVFRVVR